MKTIKAFYLAISLVILLAAIIFQFVHIHFIHHNNDHVTNKQIYTVETFRTIENGWGYYILSKRRRIIKQDIIPAIQNTIPFQSEKDAKKTALLVINKLYHRNLPTVTLHELDSLRVVVYNKMFSE